MTEVKLNWLNLKTLTNFFTINLKREAFCWLNVDGQDVLLDILIENVLIIFKKDINSRAFFS